MGFSTFNKYLKEKRIEKGISIRKLAEITNVSAMYISELERGKRDKPSPEILNRLAKGLDEPHEDFMVAAGYIDPDEYVRRKNEREDIEYSLAEQEQEKPIYLDDLGSNRTFIYQDKVFTKEEKAKLESFIKMFLMD
ncbi:helix-turn-helix transcriptional regulator [Peribacillus frigoritolerans]|uniref:helix-turn-helix domain-containing protein n=1 Tax=Peribacillus frigoritolerans TaxID=450367 RepID=UPI002E225BF1|nr:helix-turn-helix transcriptional regulator [Peribacillus frigoritolerans]